MTTRRVLVARYQVRQGHGDEVAIALAEMGRAVDNAEPRCLDYRVGRSLDDPDQFILYEEYVDQESLEAHRLTEHFRTLIEGQVVPLLERRDRYVLEPLVPRPEDS